MLNKKAKKLIAPVIGRFHDINISHGSGCYIVDVDGNKYLDFGSGIAVTSTGHCHPKVVSAIQEQAETLIHPCIAMGSYESLVTCAEKLTGLLKPETYSVFFDQSGAGAVEAALKLAKYVTKKHKVIAFEGGFHGRTMGALSVTTSKRAYQENIGPMVDGVAFFPYPYMYRSPWKATKSKTELEVCLDELKHSDLFSDDVAAVIIEPMLGEGGYVPAPKEFLVALQAICKEKGILIIMDEIQTGIGRTGHWFLFQKYQLSPDIVVTAKGLGSGLPISACLAKKHVMDQWPTGAHGGTYGGNPIACAAVSATIDVIKDEVLTILERSKFCKEFLEKEIAENEFVGDIRVEGLLIGIEFVLSKKSKEPNSTMVKDILGNALKQQLILISCGIHANVIRLAPPLIISRDELKHGLTILCGLINDYH